jgi:hypothetical protein
VQSFHAILKSVCLVALLIGLNPSPAHASGSCSSVVSGARTGPSPNWDRWPYGDACYIEWPGGHSAERAEYEQKCRSLSGAEFVTFSGDYGSGRNTCVFKLKAVERSGSSVDSSTPNNSPSRSMPKTGVESYSQTKTQRASPDSKNVREIRSNLFQADKYSNLALLSLYNGNSDNMYKYRQDSDRFLQPARDQFNAKWQEIDAEEGGSQKVEELMAGISKVISLNLCTTLLHGALDHLGERGILDVAAGNINEYKSECGDNNTKILVEAFNGAVRRYEDIKIRLKRKDYINIEPAYIGEMSAAECKGRGGVPESSVLKPEETDPMRGCWRHIFIDRRPPKPPYRGVGLCPDGSDVSTTGTCPAR